MYQTRHDKLFKLYRKHICLYYATFVLNADTKDDDGIAVVGNAALAASAKVNHEALSATTPYSQYNLAVLKNADRMGSVLSRTSAGYALRK
jgi:hypothetical protein